MDRKEGEGMDPILITGILAAAAILVFFFYSRKLETSEPAPALREESKAADLGAALRRVRGYRRDRRGYNRAEECLACLREAFAQLEGTPEEDCEDLPALEWLTDNAAMLEQVLMGVREEFRRRRERLPALPGKEVRVSALARAWVAQAPGTFREDPLVDFLQDFQRYAPLTLAELAALPAYLRLSLLEETAASALAWPAGIGTKALGSGRCVGRGGCLDGSESHLPWRASRGLRGHSAAPSHGTGGGGWAFSQESGPEAG